MFEQQFQLWDLAIVLIIVVAAGFYLYRRMRSGSGSCGKGCGGCPSQAKEDKGQR